MNSVSIRGSSNGRTTGFGPVNLGSSPSPLAMKSLKDIFSGVQILSLKGNFDFTISSITINSSAVVEGSLFIAIKGINVDGHDFIEQSIDRGAVAVVYEHDISSFRDGVTYIKVADTHQVSGIISANFFGNPSDDMKIIGVTGTNGKTTVTTLLHQLFQNLGYKSGLIGTVVNKIGNEETEAIRTTPDPVSLHSLLAKMRDRGCEYVFMEVSSHAIDLKRISGMHYVGGIFTNLTQDHLDFHKTMEEYAKVKKSFFTSCVSNDGFVISNKDSSYGDFMVEDFAGNKYFYSRDKDCDFNGYVDTKLVGYFNQSNVLAVLACAVTLGINIDIVKKEIPKLDPAPGRFVAYKSANGATGIVDYAHTPDAVENVLGTIRKLDIKNIITVIGCGGDRDKGKRPIMAKIAYDLSDVLILTADNPRREKVEDILADMQDGIKDLPQEKVHIVFDRRDAIKMACELADSADCVALLGKGHESYQEINGTKTHFDDMEEIKKFLK